MTSFPRTEREARARSERKLRAVEKKARAMLMEIAAFWDEGQVTGEIDLTLENLDRDITAIRDCMDAEIEAHEAEGWGE